MDKNSFCQGITYLKEHCEVFSGLYKRFGRLDYTCRDLDFNAFLRTIVNQQLSGKAANTILTRVYTLLGKHGGVSEKAFLMASDSSLRDCGISFAKIRYINGIAESIVNKSLVIDELKGMSDEELLKKLIYIRGIGEWSAQILMLFYLGRLSVFPKGDVSLEKAFIELVKEPLQQIPTSINKWSPYAGIVAVYFWHHIDNPTF
jgi:DNA-3-methyladenine glycosylase II